MVSFLHVIHECDSLSCRCANALVFYGLNYNIRNLAGNMYLNFFLLLVVDFPSTALCCYCLQRYENAFLNLRSRRFVTFRSDDYLQLSFDVFLLTQVWSTSNVLFIHDACWGSLSVSSGSTKW